MICPTCTLLLHHDEICRHHLGDYDVEPWSTANRILCDLIHRGLSPPRLAVADREPLIPDLTYLEVA